MKKYVMAFAIIAVAALIAVSPKAKAGDAPKEMIFWRAISEIDRMPLEPAFPGLVRLGVTIKSNLIKVHNSAKNQAWIYNMETKRCVVIDYYQKTIAEGSFDQLKEYYARRDVAAKGILEAETAKLDSLDPKVRDETKKIIKDKLSLLNIGSQTPAVSPGKDEPITVIGREAKPMIVKLGGEVLETFWVADDIQAPAVWRDFVETMSKLDPLDWKIEASIKGFPMRAETTFGGRMRSWEVTTVTMDATSLSEFMVPTNFKTVDFPKNP